MPQCMLTGTNLSGIHSLGLMKRSDIKTRPLADKTVAALEPEESAGLHVIGDSSSGKSILLQVATSVWGRLNSCGHG